jgi:CBS domain containing-hemolysin-like protein
MSTSEIALIALLVMLLLAAVFLAAAEASLLRISELRVKSLAEGDGPRAGRLLALLERLPAVLNMILLLALLAQIGAATVTGFLAQRLFGNIGVTVASVVLTFVLFVYGEAIPKTYAIKHSERTALRLAGPVAFLDRILRPFVALLVWVADVQLPGKGITTTPTVTEEELRLLAGRAAHEGEITEHDLELIERAFRFGDRSADDIMVPRPDMVAIEAEKSVDEAIDIALRAGHRRLPVFKDTLESIVGVVRLRDLIAKRDEGVVELRDVILTPLVVPESKKVSALLEDMRSDQNHLAIVVDEYGVTAGLVTIEDVAEELLGTLSEEGTPEFEKVSDGRWRVVGSLPVEDLERVGMTIPDGDWNTAAGLMVGVAGRLLDVGDHVEINGLRMTAESVTRRRITLISIEALHTPPER